MIILLLGERSKPHVDEFSEKICLSVCLTQLYLTTPFTINGNSYQSNYNFCPKAGIGSLTPNVLVYLPFPLSGIYKAAGSGRYLENIFNTKGSSKAFPVSALMMPDCPLLPGRARPTRPTRCRWTFGSPRTERNCW